MTIEAQNRALPAKPSLEHLRKEAKQQLAVLRSRAASVQLADAQLVVARSYGFSSWRALKTEVDSRREALGMEREVGRLAVGMRASYCAFAVRGENPMKEVLEEHAPLVGAGCGKIQAAAP